MSFLIAGVELKPIFIQKESWRWFFLDRYLKFLTTTFFILNKFWKKSIVTRNVDQKMSTTNLIAEHFILNFNEITVFQLVTTSFVKSYQSKKITKSSK